MVDETHSKWGIVSRLQRLDVGGGCRELTQNSQPVRNKKYRKHMPKKNNHTHKTVFTWFSNLPTSTELQRFHYYQGKNTSTAVQFFLSQKNTTLITKTTFSTSCTRQYSFFHLKNLPLKTTQHYSSWVGSSTGSNTTRLHKSQTVGGLRKEIDSKEGDLCWVWWVW